MKKNELAINGIGGGFLMVAGHVIVMIGTSLLSKAVLGTIDFTK